MKKLNMFQTFDFANWQKGKKFMIQSAKYNEKKGCVSLDVVIVEDATDYGDPNISNIFEKFKVHCITDVDEEDVDKYSSKDMIIFKRIGKCTVWGDYARQSNIHLMIVMQSAGTENINATTRSNLTKVLLGNAQSNILTATFGTGVDVPHAKMNKGQGLIQLDRITMLRVPVVNDMDSVKDVFSEVL